MKNLQLTTYPDSIEDPRQSRDNLQLRWLPLLIFFVVTFLLVAPTTVRATHTGWIPHPTGSCPQDFAKDNPKDKTWCDKTTGFCTRPGNTAPQPDQEENKILTNVECNYSLCDGLQLFVTVARWLLGLAGGLALVMFVLGGFSLIRSKGEAGTETNPGGITKAKSMLKNALIGFIIVLASWQIVNAVIALNTAGKTDVGQATIFGRSWSSICTKK